MKEMSLILKELGKAGKIDEKKIKKLVDEIVKAGKISVLGYGRSGYVGQAFLMRLKHLGLKTTSKPGENDLTIVVSGSGKTRQVLSKLKKIKSKIICITMNKDSPIAREASLVILLKAFRSKQPLRSLFEQEVLLFLDALVMRLMKKLKVSEKKMWRRHK